MDAKTSLAQQRDILPMSVAQMGFLVDKLFDDCSPLQFLRELTKNAIEAIRRLDDPIGEIRWDVDWNRLDLTNETSVKLCLIDTGVGMTGVEMVEYINKLSSSISKQSKGGNFGVGAKISAAPLNPEGLVYLSWKDGKGYMIHLYNDADEGVYGLKRFPNGEFWATVNSDIKPEPIKRHGTMVVLLGGDASANTVEAPLKAQMPRKWILRYLNTRFFEFPSKIDVKAREGWDLPRTDKHNFLRTVTGQGPWLDAQSQERGVVRLKQSKANARWWIIKQDADVNSGHYAPGGHVAALYQSELYELVHGNAGYARLQAFGVVFGCERVVVYVEPDKDGQIVSSNTARTNLLIESEPLNWAAYAAEFRANMPDVLVAYQDAIGLNARHSDYRKAIRERLNTIRELFHFGRYRPKKGGGYSVGEAGDNTGGSPDDGDGRKGSGSSKGGGRGGKQGDIYALFTEQDGTPAELINSSIEPAVDWLSESDGTRASGDLEDRAARYLAESNRLLINADFRAFTDMIERWKLRYERVAGADQVIVQTVREWFSQQLIETIMSAWALKQGGRWSMTELRDLWSETALTAAILPRYHIDINIKRALGQRLGKLSNAA